jgi:hypothetical protein
MQEIVRERNLETGLGPLHVTACVAADLLHTEDVSISIFPIVARVPVGLTVERCSAILLNVHRHGPLECINFRIEFSNGLCGRPCTGQYVEAQEWSNEANLVVIGTEDAESLNRRYPALGLSAQSVVIYSPTSMTLRLEGLAGLEAPSFHFLVSENPATELFDVAAWFAVDELHEHLQKAWSLALTLPTRPPI